TVALEAGITAARVARLYGRRCREAAPLRSRRHRARLGLIFRRCWRRRRRLGSLVAIRLRAKAAPISATIINEQFFAGLDCLGGADRPRLRAVAPVDVVRLPLAHAACIVDE